MISIKFDPELLPITGDICKVDEKDQSPLFTDEVLSWFKEYGINVYMTGIDIWYERGIEKYTEYQKPLSEMSLGLFATSSYADSRLVFENENDAMLFKLAWS